MRQYKLKPDRTLYYKSVITNEMYKIREYDISTNLLYMLNITNNHTIICTVSDEFIRKAIPSIYLSADDIIDKVNDNITIMAIKINNKKRAGVISDKFFHKISICKDLMDNSLVSNL